MGLRVLEEGSVYANPLNTTKQQSSNGGVSWTNVKTLSLPNDLYYYYHSGVDTPNYHKRRRAGELIPITPWQQVKVEGRVTLAKHELQNGSNWSRWTDARPLLSESQWSILQTFGPEDFGFDVEEIQRADNEMLQRAAAGIYARGWDSLTFFAEIGKTVSLFTGLTRRVRQVIQRGAIDQAWLEGRYGWRILLYDIEDIQKLVNSLTEEAYSIAKERAGTTLTRQNNYQVTYSDTSGTRYYDVVEDATLSIRGNVLAKFRPPKTHFNPFLTGWELTKFSFLIDWVVDVGQWLEAMSFLALAEEHTAAYGHQFDVTKIVYLEHTEWASGWSGNSAFASQVNLSTTGRFPSTVPISPSTKLNINFPKVLDLAALYSVLFRRK